ncbi:MAG: DNA gyrase inhibitor YacG [Oligoflexia bacterium]|nr:DNA gyrase inhibitor YacG [Oligoflexia bacterium]
MKVNCPQCQREVSWEQTPTRPFCSERCKLLDLGAWAVGNNSFPDDHGEQTARQNITPGENHDDEES